MFDVLFSRDAVSAVQEGLEDKFLGKVLPRSLTLQVCSGTLCEFNSMIERELPCYFPGSFISSDQYVVQEHFVLFLVLTRSVTGGTRSYY